MASHSKIFSSLALIVLLGLLLATVVVLHLANQRRESARLAHQREMLLLPEIEAAARAHGLPASLVRAVIWKESNFDAQAVGSCGEIGLMQIMEGAVQDWARVNKCAVPPREALFDPQLNMKIGCWYLARCGEHWNGYAARPILQLAEYNAGRKNVLDRWRPATPETQMTVAQITFPDTRRYITLILNQQARYEREARAPAMTSTP